VPGVLFYQGYTPVPGHSCIASNFSFLGALHCGYQFLVGDDLDALRSNRVGFLGKAVAVVDLASNVLLLAPFVGTDARGAIKATAAGILRTALRRAVSEGELRTLDELGGHAGAQLGEGEYQQLDQGARQGEGQERPVDTGGGCGCFVAGTQVATPGGSISIERLHKGMRVLAEDPKTGKVDAEPVVRLITDQVSPLLAVELSDGTTLKVTADHPFWVDSGDHLAHSGWLHAEHLRPGDRLRTATGKDVVVVRVRRNVGHAVVYTLTVARDHTFFVGNARVLVHNADGELCFTEGQSYNETFDTPQGKVEALTDVRFEETSTPNDTLHLADGAIYPVSGGEITNAERIILSQRRRVFSAARSQGFHYVRLTYERVRGSSSANPGKNIDLLYDLVENRTIRFDQS